jgi:hypothetical protein
LLSNLPRIVLVTRIMLAPRPFTLPTPSLAIVPSPNVVFALRLAPFLAFLPTWCDSESKRLASVERYPNETSANWMIGKMPVPLVESAGGLSTQVGNIDWNCIMNTILRLLLNGMFVSVVCVAQQRTALPEDATSKKASAKKAEATELRTHFSFKKRGKLISRPVGMPAPGPYYTCLVKMDEVDRFPYEYAMHWDKLQVFDAIEGHAVDADQIIRRRSIDPNTITDLGNGEFVAIGSLGHRSSGGRPRRLELYEFFLGSDGRTLTRQGRKILGNGPAGSYDAEELETPTTIVIGDTWHLIYVGTRNRARENTVLGAVGTLDVSAPKTPELSHEDQTRDFHQR